MDRLLSLGSLFAGLRGTFRELVLRSNLRFLKTEIWLANARGDAGQVLRMAKATGYKPLDITAPVFGDNASDTVFILGSGSSINELSDEDFSHIGEHVSIGLNVWLIHRFIPSAYSLEYERPEVRREQTWLLFEKLLSNQKLAKKKPKLLHLRPSGGTSAVRKYRMPAQLKEESLIYGRTNIFSKSEKSLDSDVEALFNAYQNNRVPKAVLPDNGASVVRLLFLALLQGFRKIILVGVDLNSSPYFWHEESSAYATPENMSDFPRPSSVPHDTLDANLRPFPTDKVVYALARTATNLFGAKVFVGSRSSSLAPTLPVYEWNGNRAMRPE